MKRSTVLAATMAMGLAFHANATDYYWIGGASGNWDDGANWSLTDGGEAAYAYPGASDAATFGSAASIAMSAGVNVSNIIIGAGVRVQFASSDYKVLQVNAVTADATSTLALSNVIVIPAVDNAPISGQIELVAGTTNGLYGASGKNLQVNGNLTGSGVVYFRNYAWKGSRGGVNLNGDNSQFSGVAHILMAEGLDMRGSSGYATKFKWTTLASGSANARWIIEGSDGTNGPQFPSAALTSAENPFRLGTLEGYKNVAGGQDSVFYLEVGNAMDFEYGGTISRGSSSNGTRLTKVGTGTMTFSGKLDDKNTTSSVTIKEGAVKFSTATSLPAAGIIMAGGELKAGIEDGVKVDVSSKISTSSTAAVVYDDEGDDSIWASLGAVTTGLVKKGSGLLTIKSASYTGATKVEAGRLNLPVGMIIESLDVEDGAVLGLYSAEAYSEPTAVFTIMSVAEGVNLATAIPNTATQTFSFEVDEGTGAVTVKVVRSACVFTWTGSADTAWENGANWTVGEVVASTAPLAIDTALFPAGEVWTTVLSSQQTVTNLTVNGDTTISGALIQTGEVFGDGKITLGDAAGFCTYSPSDSTLVVSNDIEIAATASSTNTFKSWNSGSASGSTIYLYGDLTGTGTVCFTGPRLSCSLRGDNSAFAGVVYVEKDSNDRNGTHVAEECAASTNAVWNVNASGNGNFTQREGGTFRFGSLNGSIYYATQSAYKYQTIEVGHLGVDDGLGGQWFPDSYKNLVVDSNQSDRTDNANRGHCLRKVGGGTLTFSGKYLRKYEVNGGTLLITADDAFVWTKDESTYRSRFTFGGGTLAFGDGVTGDPSPRIVASTAPICFSNGVSEAHVWATALAASNVGGLTKKGAGTLTLSEKPLYTGLTTVEAGKLEVPAGTELSYNAFSDTNLVSGATITNYAYAANTTLVAPATSGSVTYDKPLDISNVKAIDASGVTLTKGQPYVIASATAVTGYTKASLAEITLTLPDGADAAKWVVKVLDVDGKRALCVAPKTSGTIVFVR